MATVSVHQKVVQKLIAMLSAVSDVTQYVPAAQMSLAHISTLQDPVFPAITFHVMPGLGKSVSDGGLQRMNIQMDLWFKARGANSLTWDDVFTCYQACLNTLHRSGGNDPVIGVKIIEITNVQEGPMMWEEDTSLMHWPSKFRVLATV